MTIAVAPQPKLNSNRVIRRIMSTRLNEVVAMCPKCKTLETLWLTEDGLLKTRKFSQEDSKIYHDCGSSEPCRLFRAF
jgi:hypothetical protein